MKRKFLEAVLRTLLIGGIVFTAAFGFTACGNDGGSDRKSHSENVDEEDEDDDEDVSNVGRMEPIDPELAESLAVGIEAGLEDYDEEVLQTGYLDYSMELFRRSVEQGENSMISPMSVMMALDMVAAGAKGQTQEQLVDLFADDVNQAQMAAFCRDLLERYNNSQEVELHLANSVWIRDRYAENIMPEYLVTLDTIFNAEARIMNFGEETVDAINQWCDENTNGMIPLLINQIPDDTTMYLINATAIEAPWEDPYEEYQVKEEEFTNAQGIAQDARMMYNTEGVYFETEDATGFMKYYEGDEYAFLAILPAEGMSVDEYVDGLTGEKYAEFWNSLTRQYEVRTVLPQFTYEYGTEMSEILKDMGVTDAFDGALADLSGIAGEDSGLYINSVIHKTFIEVNENATRAAAATAVEMSATCSMEEPEYKEVRLDRPFVYAIIEVDTGMPIFIGTVQDIDS